MAGLWHRASGADPEALDDRSCTSGRRDASDEDEFVSLMRDSRAFHRPWASAPTDPARFAAYLEDSKRPDFEAFLVCRTVG